MNRLVNYFGPNCLVNFVVYYIEMVHDKVHELVFGVVFDKVPG